MTVFAILTHGDPGTFRVAAEALSPSEVVVHVDATTDDGGYPRAGNITYVRDRTNVRWGGFSVVEATEKLYMLALQKCSSPDEYIVLLSGQCVPIRPLQELEALFIQRPGVLYCRAGLLLDGYEMNERRILREWHFDRFDARGKGLRGRAAAAARKLTQLATPTRKKDEFSGFTMVAGSQWTALTAGAVASMMSDDSSRARLAGLLRYSLAPDEIYFHTLIHSGEWASNTTSSPPQPKGDKRTADFANLHHIDRSLTRYLAPEELRDFSGTLEFFARKAKGDDLEGLSRVVRELTSQDGRR
ncbi:MAG: beta-1,6-N-acetylglucosaminyltransferase [Microbacterium enclense]